MEAKSKNKIKIIIPIVIAAALVVVALAYFLSPKGYRSVKLLEMGGIVTFDRGNDKDLPVYDGMSLEGGDTMRTGGDESFARMNLDETKFLFMEQETQVDFDLSRDRITLNLAYGAITNEIEKKLNPNEVYEVKSPNALMAVRGTRFYVHTYMGSDGKLYTQVATMEGQVDCRLVNPDGSVSEEVVSVSKDSEAYIYYDEAGNETDYVVFDENGNIIESGGSKTRNIRYEEMSPQTVKYLIERIIENSEYATVTQEELERILETIDSYDGYEPVVGNTENIGANGLDGNQENPGTETAQDNAPNEENESNLLAVDDAIRPDPAVLPTPEGGDDDDPDGNGPGGNGPGGGNPPREGNGGAAEVIGRENQVETPGRTPATTPTATTLVNTDTTSYSENSDTTDSENNYSGNSSTLPSEQGNPPSDQGTPPLDQGNIPGNLPPEEGSGPQTVSSTADLNAAITGGANSITIPSTVGANAPVELSQDFNGSVNNEGSLKVQGANIGSISNSGLLELDGSSGDVSINSISNNEGGTVSITGGNVTAINNNSGGTVNIDAGSGTVGGAIYNSDGYSFGVDPGDVSTVDGTLNISSGNVSAGITNDAGGAVNITGGTVSGNIENGSGTIDINNGGTVSGNISNVDRGSGAGTININGGTVTGNIDNTSGGTVNIGSGGSVNSISVNTTPDPDPASGNVNIDGLQFDGYQAFYDSFQNVATTGGAYNIQYNGAHQTTYVYTPDSGNSGPGTVTNTGN